MNNILYYANKVYYDIIEKNLTYEKVFDLHTEFVQAYPLVVKYMCIRLYNSVLFSNLLEETNKQTIYESTFKKQAVYVKKLLCLSGYSKITAKKQSEQDLSDIEIQINSIKKIEKNEKRKIEQEKYQNKQEIRKEFIEFIKKLDN